MAIPARVIRDLPKLTWRGLFAPCEAAPVEIAHAQVEREQYGIDGAWHDHAGRKALDIKVKLHFLNTMFDGIIWFPNKWNDWQKALLDGSPGKLRHPILGEIDAVPITTSIQLEARQSGGVSVDVTFRETLVDVTKPSQLSTAQVDVKAVAKQAITDAGNLGINFPSGRLDGSLLDAIDSFLGSVTSATMTITGLGNQLSGGIEDMITRVETITDPAAAPAYDNLVLLWDAIQARTRDAEKIAARSTASRLVSADTTFDRFGGEYGNSVEQLMSLNPGLIRFKFIPAQTRVTYYTNK